METNDTPGIEPEDLLEQFVRLEWLLRRQNLRNHHRHGPMATPQRGQGRILSLLKLKPEMSQKELSSILDMRPQSLGELLSKLEKAGYIERTPSQADRRGMDVKLTEAGHTAAEQPDESTSPSTLFGVLNEEERTNLSAYFAKIIESLKIEDSDDFPERMHGRPGFGHGHRGGLGHHDHGPTFGHGPRGHHAFFGQDFRDSSF